MRSDVVNRIIVEEVRRTEDEYDNEAIYDAVNHTLLIFFVFHSLPFFSSSIFSNFLFYTVSCGILEALLSCLVLSFIFFSLPLIPSSLIYYCSYCTSCTLRVP